MVAVICGCGGSVAMGLWWRNLWWLWICGYGFVVATICYGFVVVDLGVGRRCWLWWFGVGCRRGVDRGVWEKIMKSKLFYNILIVK